MSFVVILRVPLPSPESNVKERLEVVKYNSEVAACSSVLRVEIKGLKSRVRGQRHGALSNCVLEMQSKIKGQGKELGISFQGGTE